MSLSLIEVRYLFFFDHRYHNATFRYSGAPAPLEKVSVVYICSIKSIIIIIIETLSCLSPGLPQHADLRYVSGAFLL